MQALGIWVSSTKVYLVLDEILQACFYQIDYFQIGAVHDSDEDDDILMKTKLVWLIIMRIGGECSETQ